MNQSSPRALVSEGTAAVGKELSPVGEPIQPRGCSNAIIDRPMPPVPLGNFSGVLRLHAWSPLRQSLARADVLRAAASPHCLAASPKLLVRLTETLCQVVAGTIRPFHQPRRGFFSPSLEVDARCRDRPSTKLGSHNPGTDRLNARGTVHSVGDGGRFPSPRDCGHGRP